MATAAPPETSSLFMDMPEKPSLASIAVMTETQEWHWQIKVTRGALAKLASNEPQLHLRVVIIILRGRLDYQTTWVEVEVERQKTRSNLRRPSSIRQIGFFKGKFKLQRSQEAADCGAIYLIIIAVFSINRILLYPAVSCPRVTS